MKLNKKALLTIASTTLMVGVLLVGCSNNTNTNNTNTNVVEDTTKDTDTTDGGDADTTIGEEVVESEGDIKDNNSNNSNDDEVEATPSNDLYYAVVDGVELPKMQPADDTILEDMYGINAEEIGSYSVHLPLMNVQSNEIAIFELKDGNDDMVKNAIAYRQESLENTWEQYLPEQYELVKGSRVVEKGNFILYVIGENSDTIVEKFNTVVTE